MGLAALALTSFVNFDSDPFSSDMALKLVFVSLTLATSLGPGIALRTEAVFMGP
jgi:hypothetical protein